MMKSKGFFKTLNFFALLCAAAVFSACNSPGNKDLNGVVGFQQPTSAAAAAATVAGPAMASFDGLTAISSVAGSTMQLNWNAPTGTPAAVSYMVYNMTSGSQVFVAQVTAPTTSYLMTGLSPSTTYTFRVRMTDTNGNTDTNTNDKSATTTSVAVTFNGWSNVKALGPRVPAAQATDLTSAPAQATLSWNAVSVTPGSVSTYNIYRSTTSNGQDFNSPLAVGISTAALSYTDTTVVSGQTYYYKIAPVISGTMVQCTATTDLEISVIIPPNNMSLIHPWIANLEMCGTMGLNSDRANSYRCPYTGPTNNGGYYNMPKALMVDTYGAGCNYTYALNCGGASCIGLGAPGAVGSNGDVYYDRSTGTCYLKAAGAWVGAAGANSAQLALLMSNAPGLPPLLNINQAQSMVACNSITVAGYVAPKRLMKRSEYVVAAAWDPLLSHATISSLEYSAGSLYLSHGCNSNSGTGITFDNNVVPTDLNTLPATLASTYKVLRNGNTATTSCVSRYGVQDLIGSIYQFTSDMVLSSSSVTHTMTAGTSLVDGTNTDWNGLVFDGITGPGGVGNLSALYSAMSYSATQFNAPLGMAFLPTAAASWGYQAIGTGGGQIDPAKFHNNSFWYSPDTYAPAARMPTNGAYYATGSSAGRWTVQIYYTTGHATPYFGSHCALPVN